jgi:lipid II:glycine glycyltransferase (peptidoglycan interpeptide bridge formation enzyme)
VSAAPDVLIGREDPGPAWDAFVAAHPHGHLMQSRAWAAVWRARGWTPIYVRLADGDRLRATTLVLRLGLPPTGLALLYVPRGPVLDYGDGAAVDALAAALRRAAADEGAFMIQTDPAVPSGDAGAHAALEGIGFRRVELEGLVRVSQPIRVMRIPLDRYGGPEGLRAALPHKTRYNIGLAERRGVTVVARTDRDALVRFHRMLVGMGRAKGFLVRGLGYHEALWRHCVAAGLGEYLFAERAGRALGGIQILRFGPRAWYMYGASADEDRHLMPSYLLQWTAITRAWDAGCRCYDMRGVYSAAPRPGDPEYGVYDFKRKFLADMVTFLGEYDLVTRPAAYALWRRLERAAQRPAAWLLALARRARRRP